MLPAKDNYHDIVKRALIKDGFIIDEEQVALIGSERQVVIDFQVYNAERGTILIEVKGFQWSMVEALANAIGKLVIYRYILDEIRATIPVWLVVSEHAYPAF